MRSNIEVEGCSPFRARGDRDESRCRSPLAQTTPSPRRRWTSRATPVRKQNGKVRPLRPSRTPASRSSFCRATSRTTSRISMASISNRRAKKLGWKVTVIDGKGSPTSWLAGMNQAIALKPNGIAMFADAASLKDPIKAGVAQGIKFVGSARRRIAGPAARPQPVRQYPGRPARDRQGRSAMGDRRIPTARRGVVILTHNEYAIAEVKSMATKAAVEKCAGCKVLEYVNSPASEAAQRQPQLTTSWVQRFGLPFYATSVGDNDLDFAVPVLRAGGVEPDQVKLIGADGNRSAYDRIRKGGQYQAVTVSEPIELQAYQAIDELNRAFHGQPPSGFVQPPFLVTKDNIHSRGRRQEYVHPEQRLQEALPGDLGRSEIRLARPAGSVDPRAAVPSTRRRADVAH